MQSQGLLLGARDVHVDLRRLPLQHPVAPPDEQRGHDENRAAADRHHLAGMERDRGALAGLSLDGEQVDPDHRSPALLSARPTATAAVVTTLGASVTPSFRGSKPIVLNGSNASTGAPKRSSSAFANPSTRDAPPLSRTRSMRSEEAVALKKSNVFW